VFIIAVVTQAAVGCGASIQQRAWISAQGGTLAGDVQGRADAALALVRSSGQNRIRVRVLDCPLIGAYGWPDGSLFVTKGLVQLLNEGELAAALAHEMGHLLDDGHLSTWVSLRGCCLSPDAEVRADAIGVRLLSERGIGSGAMLSMLKKVAAVSAIPSACRSAIGHRIDRLGGSSLATTAPVRPRP
jgi:predicted Zn-dependent protease